MWWEGALKWWSVGVLFSLTLGCAASPAAEPVPANVNGAAVTEQPTPPELVEAVERSRRIGQQLYVLDKVAAIGTDVLFANVADAQSQGLGGYLPLREGDAQGNPQDSFLVSFFTREEPPRTLYEVRLKPDEPPQFLPVSPPKPVPDAMAELIRARQLAIDAIPPARQPINPVVLPGEVNGEEGILVYLIAGTTTPNLAVFGQHYRVLVPVGGNEPKYVMPLTKSVLEIPTRGPNGQSVAALTVTHLVTDYPLETHVFTSLLIEMPVYVATSSGQWRVDGDRIAFLGAHDAGDLGIGLRHHADAAWRVRRPRPSRP